MSPVWANVRRQQKGGSLYLGHGGGQMTCPDPECMARAAELSRANLEKDPPITFRMVPSGIGCAREFTVRNGEDKY